MLHKIRNWALILFLVLAAYLLIAGKLGISVIYVYRGLHVVDVLNCPEGQNYGGVCVVQQDQ